MNMLSKISVKPMPVAMMATAEAADLLDRVVQAWTVSRQCRVAIRQLEVEERRVREEARLMGTRIKAETKIRLKELKQEQRCLERRFRAFEKSFEQQSLERSRIQDWIEQGLLDGQYEFATACLNLLSQTQVRQIEMCRLLVLPAPGETKLIGD